MANTQEQFLEAASQFRTAQLAEQQASRKELERAIKAAATAEKRVTRALARGRDAGMSLSDLAAITGISRSTIQRRVEAEYGKLCQAGG